MSDDDRSEDRSSDEEEGGEEDHEVQTDYCIEILTAIERDGSRYDVKAHASKVRDALTEVGRGDGGKGTILHELVKWDPKQHNIEKRKERKEDRVKDGSDKKPPPPGSTKEIKEKYHALVKTVLELDPDILAMTDDKEQTALYTAVDLKKVGILTLLCEVGSAPKYKDSLAFSITRRPKTQTNCIHEAISSKKFGDSAKKRRTVSALLDHCDSRALAQQDNEANTPLHTIMKYEHLASFDKLDKVKPLIDTMVAKCPESLKLRNKLGFTPFQFLMQVCKINFIEDYKARGFKDSKLESSRQGDRGDRRLEAKMAPIRDLPQNQMPPPPPPPQQGLQKRDTMQNVTPASPVTGDNPADTVVIERLTIAKHTVFGQSERTITSRNQDVRFTESAPVSRLPYERTSSRRPDANSKSTRTVTRTEGNEVPSSRRAVADKGSRMSDDDVNRLYTYIETVIKRAVLQSCSVSEASTALYGRVPITNKQLDFNLIGTTQPLSAEMIKEYFSFLKFESILKFVALPMLKPDLPPTTEKSTSQPNRRSKRLESKTPDHYREIFDWLRPNVQQVLQIIIEDDLENPHSDEDIEEAIRGLGVEEWKWRKYDISSGTILKAASDVKILHLYTTGNDAVLQGWLAPNGLKGLKKLEKVVLHIKEPQSERTKFNIEKFKQDLTNLIEADKHEKQIDHETLINLIDSLAGEGRSNSSVKLAKLIPDIERAATSKQISGRPEKLEITEEYLEPEHEDFGQHSNRMYGPGDRGLVHRWLDNVNKCRAWMMNVLPRKGLRKIKIALIDDGVDASHGKLKGNIHHGIAFGEPQPGYHNVPSSYYASSSGHGTLMASLITFVCPWVEFYIAKMDDHNVRNGGAFTARSAARAVEWAVEHEVDIISMSWTIDNDESIRDDLQKLDKALLAAASKQILMFCAARDEGIEGVGGKDSYPAAAKTNAIFKIGAAAPTGVNSSRVHTKAVHYLVPGTDLREFWQYADLPEMSAVDGSSSATALAAGLAALVLVILSRDVTSRWEPRNEVWKRMHNIFESVSQGEGSYLQVWGLWPDAIEQKNVFDPDKKAELLQMFCEKLIQRSLG